MSNSLFSSGDDWQSNACMNWSHDSIGLYIDGYRKSADILIHKVVESASDQDIMVYPICFLYRQYIELQLKSIIRESRILLDEGSGFPEHHKIKNLWHTANGLMTKIIKKVDSSVKDHVTKKDIDTIERIINDFVEIDPESFAFRYPEDLKGNNNLEGIIHINLRNLHDQIDLLAKELDKFDLVVGHLREWKSDIQATHGP